MLKLDRCVGSCNTVNEDFNLRTEDFHLSVLSIIIAINELKFLTKYISCEITKDISQLRVMKLLKKKQK